LCVLYIITREEQRIYRIEEVAKTLEEAKKQGREVDKTKMIMEIMNQFGVSRRTALEYLKVAEFKNGL